MCVCVCMHVCLHVSAFVIECVCTRVSRALCACIIIVVSRNWYTVPLIVFANQKSFKCARPIRKRVGLVLRER